MKKFFTYLVLVGGVLLFHYSNLSAQTFVPEGNLSISGAGLIDVSIDGDIAVVGISSFSGSGSAIIFQRTVSAMTVSWVQRQVITPSDGGSGAAFGASVHISGNLLIVGAPGQDNGEGAAYIFERNPALPVTSQWAEIKKLSASDGVGGFDGDRFGTSVSISGDFAIVGAPNKDFPDPPFIDEQAGSAYIFSRNSPTPNAWDEIEQFKGITNLGFFGISVAIEGDIAAVGKNGNSSFVRIYQHDLGTGNWNPVPGGTLSGPGNTLFGNSIALSNQTLIVGAPGGNSFTGIAYIYEQDPGDPNIWGLVKQITPSGTASQYGWDVDISGDLAIVGANASGNIFFHDRDEGSPDNWGQIQMINGGSQFGRSVGISGLFAVAGNERTAATLFGPDPSAPVPVTWSSFDAAREGESVALHWQTSSEQNNSHFIIERSTDGIQFSSIGEVNGAGTTTQVTDYQFMDSRPANGLNYYRLQQVDYDGTTDYSTVEVVAVNSQERQLGAIFPNPSKDGQFQVDYHVPKAEQIQISILDYTGKILRSKQMQLENGLNRLQFNLNDIGKGIYLLQFKVNNLIEQKRIVIH